jgi:hypothetical protein
MIEDLGEAVFTFVVMALLFGGLVGIAGSFVVAIWVGPVLATKVLGTSIVSLGLGGLLGQGL